MSSARLIIGDVHDVLKTLPDNSVDLVLTSPPFLALRSYLPADHPDKGKELGSEPTPGAFIDALLDVVEECRRVLAPHGSLCIELGDTYAGSGGAGGDYLPDGMRAGQPGFRQWSVKGKWPQDKSLTLVPELFRIALAYGVNPLTGRTTEPWRIRNVISWVRPNPPVGALGDKFRPATTTMVVATMSRTRYFDLDAVRQPHTQKDPLYVNATPDHAPNGSPNNLLFKQNPAGAPPNDWWAIPTEPYPGAHYATWPRDLLVRPIKAMCPERVCRFCGEPSRRLVEAERTVLVPPRPADLKRFNDRVAQGRTSIQNPTEASYLSSGPDAYTSTRTTVGWSDCGHDSWRPGVVLDPFAGSGTTLAVATGHGRDAVGVDLDSRNADLAIQRCGMFLTVEHHDSQSSSA